MELFKLLGTIAIKNEDANKAIKDTSSKAKKMGDDVSEATETAEKSGGKWGAAFSKIGGAAVKVGKVVASGMAAAGAGVAALVTKSVQSYADYEQLVGGVETLFKDSAGTVQEYAKNAYKTAGMSANAYMETVTGFSASLLQSLGGDTAKAAEKADMAITDMSDNANKFGSDIETLKTAYAGFSKGQFTLLDNLKLGYGGTQEEMKRLLKDAQAISGIEYDISSYADIVDAIHVIQTEMGVTGTTAKEASSTISGSIASMKGSWQNLLTAISSDDMPFDDYVNAFVDSVSTVANNLMPRIETALNGVVSLIDKLAPVIIGKIPELLSTLLPSVISAATGIFSSLVSALPSLVEMLTSSVIPQLLTGVVTITNSLISALPSAISIICSALPSLASTLVSGVVSLVVTLCSNFGSIIQPILSMLPVLAETLCSALLENLPILISGVSTLIENLCSMLPSFLSVFLSAIVNIISMICEQLPIILPQLVSAVISIVNLLGEQLPVLIPLLCQAIIQITTMLIEQIPVIMPMLISAVIQVVLTLTEQLPIILQSLISALPVILQSVWDVIVMIFQELPAWFGQLWQGAVDIIKSVFAPICNWIDEKIVQPIVGFFQDLWVSLQNIWDGICNAIDIALRLIASILKAAFDIITLPFRFIWENCKDTVISIWNSIREKIDSAISKIKEIAEKGFNFVKEKIITPITNAKNKAVEIFNNIRTSVQEKISALRDKVASIFNSIKEKIQTPITNAKNKVSEIFTNIKTKISDTVSSIRDKVSSVFNSVKEKMTAPIQKARDTIKGIVDKIKGFFSGMNISFPKIKLPHFSVKPSGWSIGDLLKGSIPSLGIEWYAKAMDEPLVMNNPAIFGYNPSTGKFMGGGEAGSEVVSGTETLLDMIARVVDSRIGESNNQIIALLSALLEAIVEGNTEMIKAILSDKTFSVGGREFARLVKEYA